MSRTATAGPGYPAPDAPLGAVFAWRVREARTGRGLTQDDLDGLAGYRRGRAYTIERGRFSPQLTTVERVAVALGMDPLDLLRRPEPEGRPATCPVVQSAGAVGRTRR